MGKVNAPMQENCTEEEETYDDIHLSMQPCRLVCGAEDEKKTKKTKRTVIFK